VAENVSILPPLVYELINLSCNQNRLDLMHLRVHRAIMFGTALGWMWISGACEHDFPI